VFAGIFIPSYTDTPLRVIFGQNSPFPFPAGNAAKHFLEQATCAVGGGRKEKILYLKNMILSEQGPDPRRVSGDPGFPAEWP